MLGKLQSQYAYGKVPLVHSLVFLIEIIVVTWLMIKFNFYYNSKSKTLLTIMITNGVLSGIADTVAQTLTSYQKSSNAGEAPQLPLTEEEIIELNEKTPAEINVEEVLGLNTDKPIPFNFERLVRFMAYGFIMSPIQYHWYGFMDKGFPLGSGFGTVIRRVCVDQLIYSPFSLFCFFLFMTIAEGGKMEQIRKKFGDTYLTVLKTNWMVWSFVQIINFQFVPKPLQIPFVSTIGIGWTAYLSLSNAK